MYGPLLTGSHTHTHTYIDIDIDIYILNQMLEKIQLESKLDFAFVSFP